ncbi:tRNA pseudouridine(55) synthase TruB [Chitinibacter bivalviorum]|uniref:tRNA pseudouridine synthase B n=1 Tax=Chitinibacter bivalviorum TaxID=2739434 RepID=A0A7H9BHC7_9NEIS|nr:tRNA pseudouridine(55) synthase TruB [Chitinibacter bivalviorum]QLG87732.1 tRNA pseudouridine(55) synthase TruB [Chitinibacter bivalviorum]
MAKRKLNGVLLLDKPFGVTSTAALNKCRWLFQAEKGGHTGVLDPYATGLLPLCFGEATKFAQRMLDADKAYRAHVRFGETSTTLDAEGEITTTGVAPTSIEDVKAAIERFIGPILQTPPMYSALKVAGKPMYEYARAGIELERKSRPITIYSIELISYQAPDLVIDVRCSKGTYIRVLAQDLGEALGCGAYLTGLRRTLTGGFKLEDAISLDDFIALEMDEREKLLLPEESLLSNLPMINLSAEQAALICNGMPVRGLKTELSGEVKLYAGGEKQDNARFIGLGEVGADGVLRSKRLLATGEAQA